MASVITTRERDATKAAQQFMATFTSKQLVADGWWGSYTASVYAELPGDARRVVDSILAAFQTTAEKLRIAFKAESVANPSTKATAVASREKTLTARKDMVDLVRQTAIAEGVPVDTALRICWLESKFDPNAKSFTGAKGLFQFTTIAVKDVKQRGGFDLTGKEFDPKSNAIAGMRYIKIVARDMGVPLSDAVKVYMGFNIGPSAAKNYLAGNITNVVRDAISKQAYGSPAEYGNRLAAAVSNSVTA